jgi:hypothetical protein
LSGSAILSATVLDDSRLKCWKIMPTRKRTLRKSRSGSGAMSSPSTSTRPLSGLSNPFKQRTSVDFPAPLRPIIPTISPRLTSNETPSIAGVAPKRLLTSTRRKTVPR